jgi:Leucine Rich repeat
MLTNRSVQSKTFRVTRTNPTAAVFIEALQSIAGLAVLSLDSVKLKSEHVIFIAKLLLHSKTLVQLQLYSTIFGPEHACILAEALQHNTVLTALKLRRNRFGPDGAKALAEALQYNTVLTTLELRFRGRRCSCDGIAT